MISDGPARKADFSLSTNRWYRRIAGLLKSRIKDPELHKVPDPRRGRSSWSMATVLGAVVIGILARCRRLTDLEMLTTEMSPPMRKLLGIHRRLPDTTARDLLVRVDPDELRGALHRQVRRAHRRHALDLDQGFPWGVLSLDGKVTAIRAWDDQYVQRNNGKGLMRTVTAALISTSTRVCVDAIPIPPKTNEMGIYPTVLTQLLAAYGSIDLFRVVMYDAGACSLANATETRRQHLHYVMVLNDSQPTLVNEARRLLDDTEPGFVLEDDTAPIRYTLRTTADMAGYLDWEHLQTVLHVRRDVLHPDGTVKTTGERFFVTSLKDTALNSRNWLKLLRARWGVENNCHHTFDTVFGEDDHPWITGNAKGALNVLLLRRIAYNLMALFRSRTLCGESTRLTPWAKLTRRVEHTIVAATASIVNAIRPRDPPPLSLRP